MPSPSIRRAASSSSPSWACSSAGRSRCSPGARRCSQQGGLFAPISREGALVLNNLLLTTACAAVFVGTLYPLALEALTGDKISVGPPFFNLTFAPLIVPLLIAVPFGPLLAWKRGDLARGGAAPDGGRLRGAWRSRCCCWPSTSAARGSRRSASALASGSIMGALTEIAYRVKLGQASPRGGLGEGLRNLPRAAYGSALAHAGLGLAVIGIVATTAWRSEADPGDEAGRDGRHRRLYARLQGASRRTRGRIIASGSRCSR